MANMLEMFLSQPKHFTTEGKTVEDLFVQFSYKLGLIVESVEKLPNTFIKSVKEDIVNELHNSMFRIQLSESIDHCIQILNAVQSQLTTTIQSEVSLLKAKLKLLQSTWESCYYEFQKNFTEEGVAGIDEITDEMTSTIYLSNKFLTVVDALFSRMLEARIDQLEGKREDNEISDAELCPPVQECCNENDKESPEALLAGDLNFIDNGFASINDISFFNVDSYDILGGVQQECQPGENDVAMATNDNISERAEDFLSEESISQRESNDIMDFLISCLENTPSTPITPDTSENSLLVVDNSDQLRPLQIKSSQNKNEPKIDNNMTVNYCQIEYDNNGNSPMVNDKTSLLRPTHKRTPYENKTAKGKNNVMTYEEQMGFYLKQLYPKTKEDVFQAASRVAQYLQEEEVWAKKMSRKTKPAPTQKPSRRSKLARPTMPADVQIYIKLGILPWDVKNRSCSPANDSHCQFSIPSDIKMAVLRHRSWYPTMEDKLYCFENHSIYLFDLELFGCWECIRKYYNDIYKWANKIGLVLRRIRM